jgi:flagellar hook assembly protein FlgD
LPTSTPEAPAVLDENVFRPGRGKPLHIGIKSPEGGRVIVNIFNVAGERVRRPFDREVPAVVTVDAVWDGKNEDGEPCGSGVYVVSVKGAGIRRTLKVVLLK